MAPLAECSICLRGIWVAVRWRSISRGPWNLVHCSLTQGYPHPPRAPTAGSISPDLSWLKGWAGLRTTEVGGGETGVGDAPKAVKGLGVPSPRGHTLCTSPQWARVVLGSQSQAG